MPMTHSPYLERATSKYQISTYYCQSALAPTVAKSPTIYPQSMDVTAGKQLRKLIYDDREVSHSNLISIQPIRAPGYPECSNIV